MVTIHVVPELVRFAGIRKGQRVLDVGTGTGAVALAARRAGAEVTACDLTPSMIERARENARLAKLDGIHFEVGDCEALAFPDASFDQVLSQFAHIFAPRPETAASEMLRVLKPGGRIAFAAWTREGGHAATAAVAKKHGLVPKGVPDMLHWGDERTVRERLGPGVRDLQFRRGAFRWRMMSPRHLLEFNLKNTGPVARSYTSFGEDVARREAWLHDLELAYATGADHVGANFPMHYLLTRATRAG
ncbi:MAG: class I SAM-dependent methyltransferase [Euryarchaeota archaeon]|nr:class I SAM-dependent methyltransferase [Euryarchaeota archaeon]MDE1835603.1 class I SAM-dependent methyltransferase [Euryarchaeota archaeon]MDE1878951.1 class I SAM-dependent methyltransferase [Euryarchaeota archaeon]MDE2043775.1 class I SAM-dependent methyltransferase [Thermoplasmata archaeon]